MDWSIQEIARLTGTTSRTLRHYDEIGLLLPSRVGDNGYRYYDESSLVRLQRILLLRELGLSLSHIGDILTRQTDEISALETHLRWLQDEQNQLTRKVAAVQLTISALKEKEPLMTETMFDGFNHKNHQAEVQERWGKKAYADSNQWWESMSQTEQKQWQSDMTTLIQDWVAAAKRGISVASAEAQQLAHRQVEWLSSIPGTPAGDPGGDIKGYILGLGEMYVADPRFAANYGTGDGLTTGAEFVRDALTVYAEANL